MPLDYTPSLPFGEANPHASDTPDTDPGRTGGIPWESAPGDSHVHSFRYYDARKHSFLRKFGDGRSQLLVRFKAKGGGVAATYVYYFKTGEGGQAVYEKMRGSAHPYKDVVKALLIDGGVPYTRVN